MPLTIEERWRRVMNSYHKAGGGKEYEFDGAKIVPGLLKFCGKCGLMEIDELRGMEEEEEKGCYTYEHHPLSRTERRQKRMELENYILEEVVETERMIKSYLKGEIG
ncbi:unnamed protein product [Taenia asiatica]|uniref:TnpV protein n=1 Tax=Taenia asiatica TaxID=60517 RepID=A0A0R3VW04_TAEAS|nr:unnamed protein product [Taenia asiatica]